MTKALSVLTLILALSLGISAQPAKGGKQDLGVIVSGTVMALAEDPSGSPLQVELQPSDGESYVIVNDAKGSELLRFVGSYVVVSGTVTLDNDGWKNLKVTSYQVTDDDGTITPGADPSVDPQPAPPTVNP